MRAGLSDFLILEKAEALGGTWRDNTYPGCACDVPSHLYSLSFAPRAEWTRIYPSQPELWAYLEQVADRFGLRPHIRFNTAMTDADWDEAAKLWRVRTSGGETLTARILVTAVGALHEPETPRLAGIETFEGPAFHSARWDESCDLRGKRVALIGTGASALQIAPEIAPQVAQLTVFQRTAPWVLPKRDRPVGAGEHALHRFLPGWRAAYRASIYWRFEIRALAMKGDDKLLTKVERLGRDMLERQVRDPVLRAKLTPTFRIGCKRILLSNDWYPTLERDNVEVVTAPITEVRPRAIVDGDGVEHPADVIVYGTGFDVTAAMRRLPVRGRGGRTLAEAWADQVESFYGVSVAGFPNFFLMLGPNTGLGHNSQIVMIEAQASHILSALKLMRRRGAAEIEVTAAAQAGFDARLQAGLARSVWQTGGCRSWYQDGRGRNPVLWPGFTIDYRLRAQRARARDYRLTPAGAA
jgi:cation diffusion facilitator CzcD-associated flavoprotein CzcO